MQLLPKLLTTNDKREGAAPATEWLQSNRRFSCVRLWALSLRACRWEVSVHELMFCSTHSGSDRWNELKKHYCWVRSGEKLQLSSPQAAKDWYQFVSDLHGGREAAKIKTCCSWLTNTVMFSTTNSTNRRLQFWMAAHVLAWGSGITSFELCRIQSCVLVFPVGFAVHLRLFLCERRLFLSFRVCFCRVRAQPFHLYPAGQIEWKQDSPQGEPRLAQPVVLKGHSGGLERATRPLLAAVEEMEIASVALIVCVRERMWCWFSRAFLSVCFSSFGSLWRKKMLKCKEPDYLRFVLSTRKLRVMKICRSVFDRLSCVVFQVPIIPVVFSSYSNFYLRKEKQFKSGNGAWLSSIFPHFLSSCVFCVQKAAWCSARLLTAKFFWLRRDHQIEDPSKDRDKGNDVRGYIIPLWKVLQPDALCLLEHLWLRNPEQRAAEALNIYHAPASFSPLSLSETRSSPRPPRSPQVVPSPGQETTWHRSLVMKSLLV